MPAEWERHRATWIAWPHHELDWPGKFGPIPWVYAEIARVISLHEPLEILCQSRDVLESASATLDAHGVRRDRIRLHVVPTDRVWLRDSAPTGVHDRSGQVVLVNWAFNGWAKYDNWAHDVNVGLAMSALSGLRREARIERVAGQHPFQDALQGHRMSAGSPSGKEVAVTTPRVAFQPDFVPVVLAVEVGLEAAQVDAGPLLGVALRLFDLPDEA